MPLLGALGVAEFMAPPRVVFTGRNSMHEAADKLRREQLPGAPVVDEREAFIGVVHTADLAERAVTDPDTWVAREADPTAATTTATADLGSALESLMLAQDNWIPVLDDARRVIGILTTSGVVQGYRAGLRANLSQLSRVALDVVVIDQQVGEGAPLAGRPLRKANLPVGTIVMTLQRGTEHLLPRGSSVLAPGDRVGILTHRADAGFVRGLLAGPGGGGHGTPLLHDPGVDAKPEEGKDEPGTPGRREWAYRFSSGLKRCAHGVTGVAGRVGWRRRRHPG
ncbi:MAG: CBS domain-containing protein [Acidimicrobiales bacterium]